MNRPSLDHELLSPPRRRNNHFQNDIRYLLFVTPNARRSAAPAATQTAQTRPGSGRRRPLQRHVRRQPIGHSPTSSSAVARGRLVRLLRVLQTHRAAHAAFLCCLF